MKRYLVLALGVTAILGLMAAILVGCRHEGKSRMKWEGQRGPARMEMGRVPMMGGGPMMGRGPMAGQQGQGAGRASMYLRHAQDLKLTDDQVKKLKDLETSFLKDMIDKRAKLAAGKIDLSRLMDGDNPDMGAVEKTVRANHEITADLELAMIKGKKAADAILTANQKKMVKDLSGRMLQNRPMGGMQGNPVMRGMGSNQGMGGMRGNPGMMPNRQGQPGRPAPSSR